MTTMRDLAPLQSSGTNYNWAVSSEKIPKIPSQKFNVASKKKFKKKCNKSESGL